MDLMRDCLDKRLIDRDKRPMGRVDGILLEIEPGRQPRVAYIELGIVTRANRVSRTVGTFVSSLMRRVKVSADRYKLPWGKLRIGLNEVTADVKAEGTPALTWELWLRKKIIERIPGA